MLLKRKYTLAMAAISILSAHSAARAAVSVTLPSLVPASQPVGTSVNWTANASGGTALLYRFATKPSGGNWRVVQDFSTENKFTWTALDEGSYQIAVEVLDVVAHLSAKASTTFQFDSRVTAGAPVVSPTLNPLVALYSAPPCSSGSLQVVFQGDNPFSQMKTSSKPCQPGKSVNFLLAGMYPNTIYSVQQVLTNGLVSVYGPKLSFHTGSPTNSFPNIQVARPPNQNTDVVEKVLVAADYMLKVPQVPPLATDLLGHVIWYYAINPLEPPAILLRPTPSATMMLLISSVNPLNGSVIAGEGLREVDLAGNLVRSTNIYAINLQLQARGDELIDWLAHEALRLPNGHTLTFGTVDRVLTNVQGPGSVDVVGDQIIDLDENFQVSWTWNPFNFLDPARKAPLNDTCSSNCGPLRHGTTFNDWTHSNSMHFLPSDGSLIVSVRNQDWAIKIDYGNGAGTGKIIWRLGNEGDFTPISQDPWPWFSHQHDVEFDGTNFELYDNSIARVMAHAGTTSRGQVWSLDEVNHTATPVLNVDMGVFSPAVGSAQRLTNGSYLFLNGNLTTPDGLGALPVEILPDGSNNLALSYRCYAYRVFAVRDLYSYMPY